MTVNARVRHPFNRAEASLLNQIFRVYCRCRIADQRERLEDYVERNALLEKIRGAIAGLPEVFREVVVLRYFEGFSYRQIAAILGCPAGTVMSRLNRARGELRTVLDEKRPLMVLQRKRGSG